MVNVALQKIGQDLPSSYFGVLEGQSYVYNAYLLSLSALLILAGALADAYGRRRLFVIGLVGFGGASVLCGFAPNMETLIVFRIVQGAAGALLVPGSLALLTHTFEGAGARPRLRLLGRRVGRDRDPRARRRRPARRDDLVAGRLLPERAAHRHRALGHVAVRGGEPRPGRRRSRSTGSEPRSSRWPSAASSFGAIYGQQHEWRDAVGPVAIAGRGGLAAVLFVVLDGLRPPSAGAARACSARATSR